MNPYFVRSDDWRYTLQP